MKKLLFAIAAVIAIGFTACTNKTQAPAETTEAEEVATFNVDDEAAASINALSEQIQAQDADKFKQVLEFRRKSRESLPTTLRLPRSISSRSRTS